MSFILLELQAGSKLSFIGSALASQLIVQGSILLYGKPIYQKPNTWQSSQGGCIVTEFIKLNFFLNRLIKCICLKNNRF